MSKKAFIWFGIVVLVLAVGIPFLVFDSEGDATAGAQDVAGKYKEGQSLFQTNCGTCHTLYAAGTDGNYGPNLDELLAPGGVSEETSAIEGRVLNAVENGVDSTTPGRMPAGILNKQQATEVAEFVAANAGGG